MVKKVLCYFATDSLPEDPGDGSFASMLRERIQQALLDGLVPVALPAGAMRRALDLPDPVVERLEAMGQEMDNLSPGRVAGGLLLAASRTLAQQVATHTEVVEPITTGLRPMQVTAVQAVAPHLKNGRLALVEAGTGSGKSRIIAHLAAYTLALRDAGHSFAKVTLQPEEQLARAWSEKSPAGRMVAAIAKKREQDALHRVDASKAVTAVEGANSARTVLIAAPTVATLMQLITEYDRVALVLDDQKRWSLGVVLGRGQFVSPSAIADVLRAQEQPDPGVSAWLEDGCPSGRSDATRLLQRMCPGISGLADDLRSVARDFPIDDVLLRRDSPSGESDWYDALREIAASCDIVLVTHAMLAADNMLTCVGRTLLPPALGLFIDEAHDFEIAQADASSQSISMFSLRAALRNAPWASLRLATAAEQALRAAEESYRCLQAVPEPVRLPSELIPRSLTLAAWETASRSLLTLKAALDAVVAGAAKRKAESLGGMARTIDDLKAASRAITALTKGQPGSLTFSPIRRYPHIAVGPSNVDALLAARWEHTPCGALLSATLLYPGVTGPQAAPTIRRLALPPDRTVAPAVLHPHWIRSTPLMFTVAPQDAALLAPPTGEQLNHEALMRWVQVVAAVIADRIAPTAAGGTLVLMTGYERLRLLQDQLLAINGGELRERLIVQNRHVLPLSQALAEFRARAKEGARPILLGLGGAWTGVDLRDERYSDADAHKDLLLTDLVMPALPFGLNRTTTHEARVAWAGFAVEKDQALRSFLQGLGRLVRRDGLRHRRLWVLDGRLSDPLRRGLVSEFVRVVQDYPMRREFDVPLRDSSGEKE